MCAAVSRAPAGVQVPLSVHAHTASEQRRRQLEAEAAASPYRTVEKVRVGGNVWVDLIVVGMVWAPPPAACCRPCRMR